MKVQDIMTTDVATTGPDALLKDAAIELVRRRISGMPVVDDDRQVLGVISETDILAEGERRAPRRRLPRVAASTPRDPWITARFDAVTVGDAMSAPARTITPDRPVAEAATHHARGGASTGFPSSTRTGRWSVSSAAATSCEHSPGRTARSSQEIEEDVIRKAMWLDPNVGRRECHERRRDAGRGGCLGCRRGVAADVHAQGARRRRR